MKAKTFLTLACATVLAGACFPLHAQQTKVLTADKHNEYGLVYMLPTTGLEVTVTATHEKRQAGPYWQYAKKYTGSDRVIKEDADIWTIDKVSVRPFGVADQKKKYLMQLKPGATTFIAVADDGMIRSINRDVEETAVPHTPATGTTGEPLADKEWLQYVGEDFIASQSMAKQAQMLAENLMEIRDAKTSLTRGTAETMPTDGKQLELMLNSLRHQELALGAAFLGNTTTETVERTFTLVPDEEGKTTLFRMSGFAGFVAPDDYRGEPVWADIEILERGKLPVDAKGEEKKLPKDAVIYNVPGSARLKLTFQGRTLLSQDFDMAQFGLQFGLSPDLFTDKKSPSFAVFDPATGALREIGAVKEQ